MVLLEHDEIQQLSIFVAAPVTCPSRTTLSKARLPLCWRVAKIRAMSRASSAATSPAPTSRRHIASSRAETYTPQIVNNEGFAEGLVAPISTTYCSEDHAYSSDAHDEAEKPRTRHVRRANTLSKDYEDEEEKAVVKKFDRRLTLLLAFLYLLSFLDRSSMHKIPSY